MKKLSLALPLAFSLAVMAVLVGQETPPAKGTRVTVTGCLEHAAPARPIGTSGDVEATAPDTEFVLTETFDQRPAGTAGTAGSAAKVMYRLDDARQAKLSGHEGQKVEITGTVEEEARPSAPVEEEEDQPRPGSQERAPKLLVESVKMIAWSCAQ